MDYLKQNKLTLLRNNATTIEEYGKDVAKLQSDLEIVHAKMDVYKEAEHEMLKYVITFSELVKMAKLYYKFALEKEKREIVTQVFTELIFADGEFQFSPKDAYLALFKRHEEKKTDQHAVDLVSGSGGGVRTHDPLVNSQLLCH